jgi:hypothetical protein
MAPKHLTLRYIFTSDRNTEHDMVLCAQFCFLCYVYKQHFLVKVLKHQLLSSVNWKVVHQMGTASNSGWAAKICSWIS